MVDVTMISRNDVAKRGILNVFQFKMNYELPPQPARILETWHMEFVGAIAFICSVSFLCDAINHAAIWMQESKDLQMFNRPRAGWLCYLEVFISVSGRTDLIGSSKWWRIGPSRAVKSREKWAAILKDDSALKTEEMTLRDVVWLLKLRKMFYFSKINIVSGVGVCAAAFVNS